MIWKFSDFFFFENLQMLVEGKRSTLNSWEGMTVDSLSSTKASSERDITSVPKAVNNAVKLIIRISKADNERCDLYRNMNKHRDIRVLQLCQSFSIIYESQLRNQPQGDANCYCENNAFKMA